MRYYSNIAQAATLANPGGISSGTTTLILSSTNGLPTQFPFTLRIDPDTANEELVDVLSGAGTSGSPYSINRAYDGTTAKSHSFGAPVVHSGSAADLSQPQVHIANNTPGAVHGLPISAWYGRTTVYKNSDQGYNNDTTLNDDLDLHVSVSANTDYEVRLILGATGVGGNIKVAWSVPLGTGGLRYVLGPASDQDNRDKAMMRTGAHLPATEVAYGLGSLTNYTGIQEFAILRVGSIGGNLTIQHAQNVSHADVTTVRATSFLVVTKVSI